MSDKPGRVVFIGNIPYGLSEEQIISIFSSVGQVLSFRLVSDSDTGRPKGFGFAEFADTDSAASAVRNLNNYQIMGRELRVDFSHVGGKENEHSASQQAPPAQHQLSNGYALPPPSSNDIAPLPPGVELPPNTTCPDAISKTLATVTPPQLLDMLSQMKHLSETNPTYATALLQKAPQLSYAIFQALLLMGLVDTNVLGTVVQQATAAPGVVPTSTQLPARPITNTQYQHLPPQQPQMPGYPVPGQMAAPTPPMHQQGFAPTPQPVQQQRQGPPDPAALLKQVLDMPQAAVDQLPPNERVQIMALKQQYGGRMGY